MSEKHSSSAGDRHGQIAVFAAADELAGLSDQLQRLRRSPLALQAGGPAEAAAWCAANELPAVLLVDISATAHPLPALLELAALSGPACRIVALGNRQDVDLYRQLLRAGIFDYLLKPLPLDLLADTLARAEQDETLGSHGSARAGRTVACVGAGGGVGTSTLVAALGRWLAESRQAPTVLVDFDRRKGDLPLLLGLEADAGLASVLAAPEIDPRLLQRTLLSQGEAETPRRLHLLAQRPGAETPLPPDRALELGAALCQLFSLSLWDLPAHLPAGADEVLAHADTRLLLVEQSVQGARNAHRLLAELGDESAGQRLLLIGSAAHLAERPAIERAQFEDFIGRAIDLQLPHAGASLAASLLQGPLQTRDAPAYARAVEQLGGLLLGQRPVAEAPAPGLLGRLRQWMGSTPRPATARP